MGMGVCLRARACMSPTGLWGCRDIVGLWEWNGMGLSGYGIMRARASAIQSGRPHELQPTIKVDAGRGAAGCSPILLQV